MASRRQTMREPSQARHRTRAALLAAIAVAVAIAVFTALTIAVTSSRSLALDADAFELVNRLRAPWLDAVAHVITQLGLIAIVGPGLLLGAGLLIRRRHPARASTIVVGATLVWIGVWITKQAVDRPRPSGALVHTVGASYPSAHAANSVGWLALGIALTVAIPRRRWRLAAIAAGALVALLVGLSRVYLHAHYASDVIGGEALALGIYGLVALAGLAGGARHDQRAADPAAGASVTGARGTGEVRLMVTVPIALGSEERPVIEPEERIGRSRDRLAVDHH